MRLQASVVQILASLALVTAVSGAIPSVRWVNAIGSTGERTRRLSTDTNENVYVTGYFTAAGFIGTNWLIPQGQAEFFVAKYDKHGSNLWARSAGGSGTEEGLATAVDDQGNVFVISDMRSDVSFSTTNLVLQGFNNLFFAKYDSNGTFQWARQIVNVAMSASDIFVRGTNVYVITAASGNLDFGMGPLTNIVFAMANYDLAGNLTKVQTLARGVGGSITGNGVTDFHIDENGNDFAALYFSAPIMLGTSAVTNSDQSVNGLVAKWDADGNVIWFRQLTGANSFIRAMRINPDKDVALVGSAPRNGSFGGQLVTNAFFARLSTDGVVSTVNNVSSNGLLNDIEIDSAGNLFVCGKIPGANGQLGNMLVTNSPGFYPALIAKLDRNGEVLWLKTAQPTSTANGPEGFSLNLTSAGAIYVTGFLGFISGTFNFDDVTISSGSGYDSFLERIDPEPPSLRISQVGTNAVLYWPFSSPNWILQRTTYWGSTWETVTNSVFQNGQYFTITNDAISSEEYFRLKATD